MKAWSMDPISTQFKRLITMTMIYPDWQVEKKLHAVYF